MAFLKHPVFLLSVGGALGANARFWLSYWIKSRGYSDRFPWATFIANVSGAFILAMLTVLVIERASAERRWVYVLLGTGFCGAFTTFSTFEVETWILVEEGRWMRALAYVMGSVLAGFAAVVIGYKLFHRP